MGAFVEAEWGTLFLDEIDSLPMELQTKLLLFFDSQKVRPVGSNDEVKVNCRLIFASGRSLSQLVESGKMRKDFYFRINASHKHDLPTLRNSPEILRQFCSRFSLENDVIISTRLQDFYMSLPWLGNIRELKGHLIKKVKLNKGNKLDFDEIDEALIRQSSEISTFTLSQTPLTLEEMKVTYAKKILSIHQKDFDLAARELGVATKTLRRLLRSCS